MAQAFKGYFAHFQDFEHDETAALLEEFDRLAITQNWSIRSKRYKQEKNKCIAEEFQRQYGRDNNSLGQWQELCREVGLDPPASIKQCRKALSKVAVNIVDLIDSRRTKTPVRVFRSVAQLKKYSLDTGRIFSKKKAKDDGYLKVLLRKLF